MLSTPRVWQNNGALQPILVHLVPWEGSNNPLKICVHCVHYRFYAATARLLYKGQISVFEGLGSPKDQLVSAQAQMNIERKAAAAADKTTIPKISTSQMTSTWYNMMGT